MISLAKNTKGIGLHDISLSDTKIKIKTQTLPADQIQEAKPAGVAQWLSH